MKAVPISISLTDTLIFRIKNKAAELSDQEERNISVSEIISKILVQHFPKEKKHGKKKR